MLGIFPAQTTTRVDGWWVDGFSDNDTNNIVIKKQTTNKGNVTFLAVIKKVIRCV